jgi:hypothetical protein
MKHMNKKFPKGNDLLREHKETTLEKNQRLREERRRMLENKLKSLDKEID